MSSLKLSILIIITIASIITIQDPPCKNKERVGVGEEH
jgi:hypothetical protein